jgi:hypothetical protein
LFEKKIAVGFPSMCLLSEQGHQLYVNNRRVFECVYGEVLVCICDVTTINCNVWVPDNVGMWKGKICPRPYL